MAHEQGTFHAGVLKAQGVGREGYLALGYRGQGLEVKQRVFRGFDRNSLSFPCFHFALY